MSINYDVFSRDELEILENLYLKCFTVDGFSKPKLLENIGFWNRYGEFDNFIERLKINVQAEINKRNSLVFLVDWDNPPVVE